MPTNTPHAPQANRCRTEPTPLDPTDRSRTTPASTYRSPTPRHTVQAVIAVGDVVAVRPSDARPVAVGIVGVTYGLSVARFARLAPGIIVGIQTFHSGSVVKLFLEVSNYGHNEHEYGETKCQPIGSYAQIEGCIITAP